MIRKIYFWTLKRVARTEYQERKALENCRTAESANRIVSPYEAKRYRHYLIGTKGYPNKQGTRYLIIVSDTIVQSKKLKLSYLQP